MPLFTPIPSIEITEIQVWSITIACLMMVADVLVGFITAVINSNLSSTKMRKGLGHKALLLILIIICLGIEIGIKHTIQLPYDIPSCEVVCGYIIIMELISILENIKIGYPEFANSSLFKIFNLTDKKENENK